MKIAFFIAVTFVIACYACKQQPPLCKGERAYLKDTVIEGKSFKMYSIIKCLDDNTYFSGILLDTTVLGTLDYYKDGKLIKSEKYNLWKENHVYILNYIIENEDPELKRYPMHQYDFSKTGTLYFHGKDTLFNLSTYYSIKNIETTSDSLTFAVEAYDPTNVTQRYCLYIRYKAQDESLVIRRIVTDTVPLVFSMSRTDYGNGLVGILQLQGYYKENEQGNTPFFSTTGVQK
jgi:hypothetical protein